MFIFRFPRNRCIPIINLLSPQVIDIRGHIILSSLEFLCCRPIQVVTARMATDVSLGLRKDID